MLIGFANKANYKSIRQLYREAFPIKERCPFFLLRSGTKKRKADFLIVKDDDTFIAFAYLIKYKDIVYLFYFAVVPEMRNKGIGSLIIQEIIKRYQGKRIILAVEQPTINLTDYDLRIRRKKFYIKNGFEKRKCNLIEKKVIFDVLGMNGNISKEEYIEMLDYWGGKIFKFLMKIDVID